MNYILNPKTKIKGHFKISQAKYAFFLFAICFIFSVDLHAQQVKAAIDSTSIKIGEQINYSVEVVTDSTDLVVFPEGQSFSPLEVIESYKVDTSFAQAKVKLLKKYGLTQFDSGSYTIPQQRIIINEKPFLTDSMRVEVANVAIDTTKQGLYDIKQTIEVERAISRFWEYVLWALGVLFIIGAFLFWLIRRSRKKAEAERKLPPFEQALLSLKQLDEEYETPSKTADQATTKVYYSRLTDIVRRYLNEEVYDRSMESTTSELINRLYVERDTHKVELSNETIKKLQKVLETADLTKFARIRPEEGKAEADRLVVEQVVKETKEALPEPTEEELMRDEAYRKALAKRRQRRLIFTSILGVLAILIISAGVLIAIKGFDYVKDTYIGHPSKELLEGDWMRSEYGYPAVAVSTPKVLRRVNLPIPKEAQGQVEMNTFAYGSLVDRLSIIVNNTRFGGKNEADLQKATDAMMQTLEGAGAKNLLVKSEKYTTPNGAEGLKTFGSGDFPEEGKPGEFTKGEYLMLSFTTPGVIQQIVVSWREDDQYAKQIADRIINSVELQKQVN